MGRVVVVAIAAGIVGKLLRQRSVVRELQVRHDLVEHVFYPVFPPDGHAADSQPHHDRHVHRRPVVIGIGLGVDLVEHPERREEGPEDGGARDPAGEAPWQDAPAERDDQHPRDGEREDQPAVAGCAHPRSSDISSTSIGSRRRYIATMIPRPITTSQAAITITISANT